MQSSVGLAFRALVMLACLALVPFLAIYGKQLPELYKAVVDAYKARTHQKTADPLAGIATDAPPWAPTNDHRAADPLPRGQSETPVESRPAPLAAIPPQPLPVQSAPTQPGPLAGGGPAPQPLASESMSATGGAVQPASFAAPVENAKTTDSAVDSEHEAATNSAPPAPPAADTCTTQFRHVEARLRELGATYYLLETFGDGYRFYCEVSLAANSDPGHHRVFQATDTDPLKAMQRVLDDVERFRRPDGAGQFSSPSGIQR
ncbi:MAG TPA: hypothetical protein VHX65_08805 [Pirellulales bacterium]|jgi:hypothetical protein|nr:hypothetical protein [Pirellulales bacterium]